MFVVRLVLFAALCMSVFISGCAPTAATTEQKIGQMLMVGFRGMSVDEEHFIIKDIKERNLGGVILFNYDVESGQFSRNIESPAQVKKLISTLKKASVKPLLVAVDQEGGRVARLNERNGFPETFSAMNLGSENSLKLTYEKTEELARTLAEAGFTINMAPDVDLCANPDNPIIAKKERCFSSDAEIVSAHAAAYIDAHHKMGLKTTLKHFPGHGSSMGDSHLGLADVTSTWTENELKPYEKLISAGKADVVMTAHIFNAQLDAEYPATLSKKIIGNILREKYGFDKVIISDDMQMGAIVNYYGFETAIAKALEAGVDILVFGNNISYDEMIVQKAVAVIKNLIEKGVISEERIDASYYRIMDLKHNR